MGTPAYLSPEQVRGQEIDAREQESALRSDRRDGPGPQTHARNGDLQ